MSDPIFSYDHSVEVSASPENVCDTLSNLGRTELATSRGFLAAGLAAGFETRAVTTHHQRCPGRRVGPVRHPTANGDGPGGPAAAAASDAKQHRQRSRPTPTRARSHGHGLGRREL